MITNDIFRWRKSTFSGGGGNECIELGARWRKSSYSGGDPNDCIEIAPGAIRDSKNPTGSILRAELHSLIAAVREGQIAR